MQKIDLANHLQSLVNNVDEKAFLESEDKFYWIVNKKVLLNLTPEKMAKRSTKYGLEYMIKLYSKYQLGGKLK
jgi:hypothetical protein